MSFISYAQNFEDVMLWRALKHINNGFYIDVGANDPVIDSVTKAFSEKGWHGINIEPLPQHHADLVRDRPLDINLQCAAGAAAGEIELWESDVRGWATANEQVIEQHSVEGHHGFFHRVPVRTLVEICDEYVTGDIHFMKIDVEGLEQAVLKGGDFTRFRPWILVVEATRPNSTEEAYWEWEPLLVQAGYQFAYADGLNRFYIAKEHSTLDTSLRYPPNVLDNFVLFTQVQAQSKSQQAEAKAQQIQQILHDVVNSRSWRITAPLRWCGLQARRLLELGFRACTKVLVKKIARPIVRLCITFVATHPVLKIRIVTLADHLGFYQLLRSVYSRLSEDGHFFNASVATPRHLVNQPNDLSQLTPRARKIYADLKAAIEKNKVRH